MKLISMWEPWASLYVHGLKRVETRHWGTSHQGWTAVHACKGGLTKSQLQETITDPMFAEALKDVTTFHRGCIIGAVNIIACHPPERRDWIPGIFEVLSELDTPHERAFGDYSAGRYGIVAAPKTFILKRPLPFTSRQGKLLDVPADIVFEMRRQWNERNWGDFPIRGKCIGTRT